MGAAAGDICAGAMAQPHRAMWLPPALLLLWVPGEHFVSVRLYEIQNHTRNAYRYDDVLKTMHIARHLQINQALFEPLWRFYHISQKHDNIPV